MEIAAVGAAVALLAGLGYLYWRHVWFFRNPPRNPPVGEGILSPADGTVVYVNVVEPTDPVITIKNGLRASLNDIAHEEPGSRKVHIGVFMSPFNVHYNRAPFSGTIESIDHHPPRFRNVHMGPMHLRVLLRRCPYTRNCLHLLRNERTVTRIRGTVNGLPLHCLVVQIAARSVRGIVSFFHQHQSVNRGEIFGMIRIGSQVDLVIPLTEGMRIQAAPGDKVRAGESILIDWDSPGQELK